MNPTKGLPLLNQVLYLLFFTGLFCSFRALSSISIALILVAGIIKNKLESGNFFHRNMKNRFLAGCILLYLFYLLSLYYTHNLQEGWSNIGLKTGLLFTPLAVCCSNYINADSRKKLFPLYCILLALVSLYCLGSAFSHYKHTGDPSIFYYHKLVSPFKQHAVYFSVYVFIALVFLFENIQKKDFIFNQAFHICLAIFFSVLLFLLLSKLVIVFYLLYLIYFFIKIIRKSTVTRWVSIGSFILFITVSSLVLTIHNPVSERFHEIMKGDIKIVKQEIFSPADYFNGLQFRVLQWKFVTQILNENHRWWTGVSPGDARLFLDQKYISTKMYTGDPVRGDRGFLGYNTHNQFLETLLQTGITGLFILLVICAALLQMAWQKKSTMASFIIMLLLAWLFSESAFETQYGILIFTFFPLFICLDENRVFPGTKKDLPFS